MTDKPITTFYEQACADRNKFEKALKKINKIICSYYTPLMAKQVNEMREICIKALGDNS